MATQIILEAYLQVLEVRLDFAVSDPTIVLSPFPVPREQGKENSLLCMLVH